MAVTIEEILATDEIASSRLTINENFAALKDAIDTITDSYINEDTGEITASSMTLARGSEPTTTTILTVEASQSIGGDLAVTGSTALNDLTVNSGIEVDAGNVKFNDVSGTFTNLSVLKQSSAIAFSGLNSTFINASLPSAWDSLTTLSASGTNAVLSVTKKNFIMLDFSSYDGGTNNILTVQLPAGSILGQHLYIVSKIGSSNGVHLLKPTIVSSTANIAGLITSEAVSLVAGTRDYRVVELGWTGSQWIILNLQGATIVTI